MHKQQLEQTTFDDTSACIIKKLNGTSLSFIYAKKKDQQMYAISMLKILHSVFLGQVKKSSNRIEIFLLPNGKSNFKTRS